MCRAGGGLSSPCGVCVVSETVLQLFGKSNVADTPGGPMPNMQHARRVGDGSRPAAATTSRAQGKAVDRVTIRPSRPMRNPSDIAATALMQRAYCKPDGAGHAVVENDDDFATKSAYFRRRDRRKLIMIAGSFI